MNAKHTGLPVLLLLAHLHLVLSVVAMAAVGPLKLHVQEATTKGDDVARCVTIGILALQGAFAEHSAVLQRLGADVRQVRLPHEFEGLDGIVLPGGESTAMALIGERWGIFPRLKQWVSEGRPIWGTCAGMILLSDNALMAKKGGQSLVGGLNVEICRNYFGAQKSSFEVPLDTSKLKLEAMGKKSGATAATGLGPYPAVFIRAPAVLEVGPGVDILCKVQARPCNKAVTVMRAQLAAEEEQELEGEEGSTASKVGNHDADNDESTPAGKRRRLASFFADPPAGAGAGAAVGDSDRDAPEVVVALRKGNIVGTAFHPELTNDSRWHEYFVRIVREAVAEPIELAGAAIAAATGTGVKASASSSAVEAVVA